MKNSSLDMYQYLEQQSLQDLQMDMRYLTSWTMIQLKELLRPWATLTNQKTGSSRIGLVINISTGTETQDDPIQLEGYNFTFKVKGSATKYPGKSIVLTDVKDKNLKTFVDLKINNDDKVLF